MVRTVERIEQELALLDQSVMAIAQEFHDTYSQYLTVLGQAVRQQLILASYHLCTHGYPERFLKLSLDQRQQLQQALRQLAKEAQSKLLDRLQIVQPVEVAKGSARSMPGPIDELRNAELNGQFTIEEVMIGSVELSAESLAALLSEQNGVSDATDLESTEPEPAEPEPIAPEPVEPEPVESESSALDFIPSDSTEPLQTEQPQTEQFQTEQPQTEQLQTEQLQTEQLQTEQLQIEQPQTEESDIEPEPSEPRPINPKDIAHWQEQLEESVVEELQNLSHAANRLLQQTEMLPGRLPEPVLEVAAKADIASESAVSPPNLLNLLIETEDEDEKESTMTQLMAIRLRLSEIEFSDSASTIWRSKIRDLSTRLNKLGREYQKKQKERSVAQAESAWRSSWYED